MKIVHIDETFHPLYGYQVNPLAKFQSMAGHEVYIVTVEKDKLYPIYREFGDSGADLEIYDEAYEKESGVKIIRIPVHLYISDRAIYSGQLFKTIRQLDPDVILAHFIESYASIMLLLRVKKYPMVFDSHMLAMASKNKLKRIYEAVYKTTISPIIKKHGYTVIRVQDDNYVMQHLGIPASQAPFISLGSDTSIFKPDSGMRKRFRSEYGISETDFVVIYTGKLTAAKGSLFLANSIRERIIAGNDKRAVFIIVGNAADAYGEEVDRIFSESENKVIRFPTREYRDLAEFYQASDLSIFPKQCSLSFFDAQACGLPVLSEDNNINIERCSHDNGLNFKAGDTDDFRGKIRKFMEMDETKYRTMSQNAVVLIENHYSYEYLEKLYTRLLEKEYDRFHAEERCRQ